MKHRRKRPLWRCKVVLSKVIFGSDTLPGRLFDLVLILSIALSVLAVMLDSVSEIKQAYGQELYAIEWFFTILFTIEYFLRIFAVRYPLYYVTSFFGVVDLLAIAPTYLSLLIPGSQYLLVIRLLRVLRIFRVLKLAKYLGEANMLMSALAASRRKIAVFLFTVMTIVIVVGSLMYLVEGEENGFTSIPRSVYWAIVTITTVGYGDISPRTGLGQMLASLLMILGYGIIAVPTGIVTVEIARASDERYEMRVCPGCDATGHDSNAIHCKYCGAKLPPKKRKHG